ncbi:uncharacterized protein SETTUDRAFT_153176 [Exserohilum turcica Et28A]|uniref:Uncharacterized protein n=1 Tax=Exserohilum turcicum (strain 28A) TaxID=671987 RepID=R0J5M8_EXST2|nr:uncharacterized protein SETTUDRAFT_153176 [Exserohilum turcica Et28A]EOA92210.1 hypothetical protein SETTUDRAFT_153176 [Exserohilum turcica Et28A]
MLTKAKDRHTRKRPFAGWMKRLANLKPSSSDAPSKKNNTTKKALSKNNPYPESGYIATTTATRAPEDGLSVSTPRSNSCASVEEPAEPQRQGVQKSNKSTAPTVATLPETLHSTRSKAETGRSNFVNGGSTFSSPNGSEHSLTTTLTTIQSTAPSNVLNIGHAQNHNNAGGLAATPVHFSHQFPTSPPPSAIPPHMAPQQQPHSYLGATANNILTDNASILTLASSSKRRRRNSVDTNASMRALAPSSHYGGSRESLPLSVLSANPETIYSPSNRPSTVSAFVNAERASVYSASGVTAPVLTSERNSYYANKQADGLSVRSGLLGHGRTDSISSIRATPTSPLASPRDPLGPTRVSRKSSEWREAREISDEDEIPASPIVEECETKCSPKCSPKPDRKLDDKPDDKPDEKPENKAENKPDPKPDSQT